MQSGNFAEAQLRALIDVAAVAAGANRLEEVLELAAERSLAAVGGASLSISRWDAENGILHTLVNVGDVADWEERFPAHEVYSVDGIPLAPEAHERGRVRDRLDRRPRHRSEPARAAHGPWARSRASP